uniref:Uncharacterized protein n=1 Tax=Physcomitrium patens TaxID=3218 RepID=A0A7I4BL35_PHYPA
MQLANCWCFIFLRLGCECWRRDPRGGSIMSMFLKCGGSGLFFLSIVVQQLVFYVEVESKVDLAFSKILVVNNHCFFLVVGFLH